MILVIGGSYAGFTTAFEINGKLKDKMKVRVIARQKQFVSWSKQMKYIH